MTFPSTHPALARALAAREYSVPTPVQLAVLEPQALGRDLLVSAQTGSGKTVAFGLAVAPTLLGEAERFERAGAPLALVIAPTRELAMQVQRELAWLYAETGACVITCVGGMDARAEARQLERGTHIVVGTPGRLRDHIERRRLDLSQLKAVVLDEADEMLDLGFREDLEFILDATPAERQTLLFSATMPRDIETMAKRYQREALRIETARRDEQHADIEYRVMRVVPGDIENAVVNVLRFFEAPATLVFCATREAVKRMHARLAERGFSAVALSGELSQAERTHALLALRDGRARVLVATDVAARGLDLPDLSLVIHAELPNDHETLLHRSGRTGRAGRKGLCVLIVPFNRRKKAEGLLLRARLKVSWGTPPTADAIRAKDQERFLADDMFAQAPNEAELAQAKGLQETRSADEIAVALLRLHRARLPEPEDLIEDKGPPAREGRFGRDRFEKKPYERKPEGRDREAPAHHSEGASVSPGSDQAPAPTIRATWRDRSKARTESRSDQADGKPRSPRPSRVDNREMVWFRLNIGRERNADPRWILPLICKAGGVTKTEIGAIKIQDRDTRFQIVADHAEQFAEAVRTNANKEGHISRVSVRTPEDDAAVDAALAALPSPPPAPARDRERDREHRPRAPRPETRGAGSRHNSESRPGHERPQSGVKGKDGRRPDGTKDRWRDRVKPDHASAGSSAPDRRADHGPSKDFANRGASKYAHKKKKRQPTPAAS